MREYKLYLADIHAAIESIERFIDPKSYRRDLKISNEVRS